MTGVFLSYSRADHALAEQVINGLRRIGLEVWWDQDMPGVDWQDELAREIEAMVGVVVLWTPNSVSSKNVKDEARLALHKDKLINVLVGESSPPFPFERVNGLPLMGWDGFRPHNGWSRLVQTIEALAVRSGAAEQGQIIGALARSEAELGTRQGAVVQAQEAFQDAQSLEAEAGETAKTAGEAFVQAEAQLKHVGEINATSLLLRAAQQEFDEARSSKAEGDRAHRAATAQLSASSRRLAEARAELQSLLAGPAKPLVDLDATRPTLDQAEGDAQRRTAATNEAIDTTASPSGGPPTSAGIATAPDKDGIPEAHYKDIPPQAPPDAASGRSRADADEPPWRKRISRRETTIAAAIVAAVLFPVLAYELFTYLTRPVPAYTWKLPTDFIGTVSLSPDGKTLQLGGDLWDVESRKKVGTVPTKPSYLFDNTTSLSSDGKLLASIENNTISIVDQRSGQSVATLVAPDDVNTIGFSPNSSLLAAYSWKNGIIRIWDVATQRLLTTVSGVSRDRDPINLRELYFPAAFSPDSNMIGVFNMASADIFDARSGKLLQSLNNIYPIDIEFSSDGQVLLIRSYGGGYILNISGAVKNIPLDGYFALSRDRQLAAGVNPDGFICVARVDSTSPAEILNPGNWAKEPNGSVIGFTADSKMVAVDNSNNNIEFWTVRSPP